MQYVENIFPQTYSPTIENTYHKTISYKGQQYILEIIDSAGQVRNKKKKLIIKKKKNKKIKNKKIKDNQSVFQTHYSVGVHGYVLVFSVDNRKSFETINSINTKILSGCGVDKVPRVVVANKCDLETQRYFILRFYFILFYFLFFIFLFFFFLIFILFFFFFFF